MFTLINADADDDAEITDPQEIAELFAAIAAVAIEAIGAGQARQLFDAVVEQDGKDPNSRAGRVGDSWPSVAIIGRPG